MSSVLVTGGCGGIGKATCSHFARRGYDVLIVDHPDVDSGLQQAQDLAAEHNITSSYHPLDVTKPEECFRLSRAIPGPIDILVNNAGITRDGLLIKMDRESGKTKRIMPVQDWQDVINVNLNGPAYMCMAFMPGMYERGSGSVIFVASVNGQRNQIGQTNYGASKAAILHLAGTLATEAIRYGVRVNSVAPGYTHTPMVAEMPTKALEALANQIPAGRLATPEEVAEVIFFTATHEYFVGASVNTNGGLHMA